MKYFLHHLSPLFSVCFGVNIVKHKIIHQDQGISNWIFVEFMDLVKDKAVKETEMETINNVVLKRTKHNYGHTGKLLNEMIKYNRINLKFQLKSMLCWQKIDHQTDWNYLQKQKIIYDPIIIKRWGLVELNWTWWKCTESVHNMKKQDT